MKASEITQAYIRLWTRFGAMCRSAGLLAHARDPRGFAEERKNPIIIIESLIGLPSWPWKSVSDRKTVDIVVRSREQFNCKTGEIVKSTVQVVYFKSVSKDQAKPLLGVHYDFEHEIQPAHPIFHAQLDVAKITPEEYEAIKFRKKINESDVEHYSHVRIPTAYMNLSSVLLGLAADHLPLKFYEDFLKEMRKFDSIKWDAACAKLRKSICNHGGYLHAHHWY